MFHFQHLFVLWQKSYTFVCDKFTLTMPSMQKKRPPGGRVTGRAAVLIILHLNFYCLGEPQFAQNLPLFTAPHLHVHSPAGLGEPHSLQNFPLFTAPQLQVHSAPPGAGTGFGFAAPQFAQKFPVLTAPHSQVQLPCCAAGAAASACA